MGIIEIKAKKHFAGPGMWAWLAEALVEDDKGEKVYVTVHYYTGEDYSVCKQSVYDYFVNGVEEITEELLEEYDNFEDSQSSEYKQVFSALRKVIDMLD